MTIDQQRAYEAESRALFHDGLRLGVALFMMFATAVTGLELIYFPERYRPLLITFGLYAVACIGALCAVRIFPDHARLISVVAVLALIASITGYHIAVRDRGEILVLALALNLIATSVILPWGPIGQGFAGAGALVGQIIAAYVGLGTFLPFPYGVLSLAVVVGLTMLGAERIERLRLDSYERQLAGGGDHVIRR